jgi:hypothetical protein
MSKVVRVIGAAGEGSGYRQAVTNIMNCFDKSNVQCKFSFLKDDSAKLPFTNCLGTPDINFIISAPPYVGIPKGYNIGYFYWETDSFDPIWARGLDFLDEIWAPCELVKNCIEKTNFKGKIKIVPTPSRPWKKVKQNINFNIFEDKVASEECFKFYSIFQWQYRKGYDILFRSYLEEFNHTDDVILVIKTNPLFPNINLKKEISSFTNKLKKKIGKTKYPRIIIADYFFSNAEMDALHDFGDCFVLPHRGEGWGMPIARSLQYDSHIITTKFGGITEYFTENSCNLIDHDMVPVSNMEWCRLYNHTQKWAEPRVDSLKEKMRNLRTNERDYISKIIKSQEVKDITSQDYFINFIEKEFC